MVKANPCRLRYPAADRAMPYARPKPLVNQGVAGRGAPAPKPLINLEKITVATLVSLCDTSLPARDEGRHTRADFLALEGQEGQIEKRRSVRLSLLPVAIFMEN